MIWNLREVKKEVKNKDKIPFEEKVKQLEFGSELRYKHNGGTENKPELSVYVWESGGCSIRTFGHLGDDDYFVLSDEDRKLLIKQLQLVDKEID